MNPYGRRSGSEAKLKWHFGNRLRFQSRMTSDPGVLNPCGGPESRQGEFADRPQYERLQAKPILEHGLTAMAALAPGEGGSSLQLEAVILPTSIGCCNGCPCS